MPPPMIAGPSRNGLPVHPIAHKTDPLVGKWFHTFSPESEKRKTQADRLCWQGHILALVRPEVYLVQLFSWIDGDPTEQFLIPFADMKDWWFYDSSEKMNFTFEHKIQPFQGRSE